MESKKSDLSKGDKRDLREIGKGFQKGKKKRFKEYRLRHYRKKKI